MKSKIILTLIVAAAVTTALRVPGTGWIAYALLSLAPGWFLYRILAPQRAGLEALAAASVLSPCVVTALGVALLATGASVAAIVATLAGLTALLGLVAVVRPASPRASDGPLPTLGIVAALALIAFFTLQLPFSFEWWRIRSDGWFHVAVVAQIDEFGLPPDDPYFLGMPLQYMWAYHALTLILSRASGIESSMVMALLNLQALVAFALPPVLLTIALGRKALRGFSAMMMALFSMNALFWFFMPIKLARALTGEVRGMDEIKRILILPSFEMDTVMQWTIVFFNHYFFMDKFMVSTPLSLGIAMMAAAWLGAVRYVQRRSNYDLVMLVASLLGALLIHPLFGVITAATLAGGLALLFLTRNGVDDFDLRRVLILAACIAVTGVVSLPYLTAVTHAKESDNVFPLILSFRKIAGLIITVAPALGLSVMQVRPLRSATDAATRFFALAALTVFLIGLVIAFPGANLYSKPPFFVLFPLAIIGGWSLVDIAERKRRKGLTLALLMLALLGPINIIQYAAYYATPRPRVLSADEREVAAWVQENTPRDAVFFDSADRVFLLVSGPRRYYWGRQSYADLWGYDREEMNGRRAVRDQLYSQDPLDAAALDRLASIEEAVFVVGRPGDGAGDRFARDSEIFVPAFVAKEMAVFKVDKQACRALAEAM